MSIVERIITVYNDKGSKQAVKDLKNLEAKFIDSGKKIGKAFGVATIAVGAFATKVGIDAVKGAIEDQKSQALLANSLRNTTGATDDAIKAVEDYISAQQMLVAVSDTELRQSLITLTTATGDLTQAQALQNVALDTAAGTTKDLQTVSLAIAKAYNGNIGASSHADDTQLGYAVTRAQSMVDAYCNRTFEAAADTTRYYNALDIRYGGSIDAFTQTLMLDTDLCQLTSVTNGNSQVIPTASQYLKPNSIPQLVITLADYQYKAAFVADHEINILACLTEIMAEGDFK